MLYNYPQLYSLNGKAGQFKEKFDKKQKCLIPNCNLKSDNPHSVSKSWLSTICNNKDEVLGINFLKIYPENNSDNFLYLIHKNAASVFQGFCNKHDGLFQPIDQYDKLNMFELNTPKLICLTALRAIGFELYRATLYKNIIQQHTIFIKEYDKYIQSLNEDFLLYWNSYITNDITNINYINFEYAKRGILTSSYDGEINKTILPLKNKNVSICISSLKKYGYTEKNIHDVLFENIEYFIYNDNFNIYTSYDYWNNKSIKDKERILKYLFNNKKLLTVKDKKVLSYRCYL